MSSASLTQPENQVQKTKTVQSVPYVEDDGEQETDGRRGDTQLQKPVDGQLPNDDSQELAGGKSDAIAFKAW